jgi:hypothetical protein
MRSGLRSCATGVALSQSPLRPSPGPQTIDPVQPDCRWQRLRLIIAFLLPKALKNGVPKCTKYCSSGSCSKGVRLAIWWRDGQNGFLMAGLCVTPLQPRGNPTLPGTGEETAFQMYHAGRAGAQPYPPLARKRLPGADSIAPCRYVIPAFLPQVSEPFAFCLSEKPNQRERDAEI